MSRALAAVALLLAACGDPEPTSYELAEAAFWVGLQSGDVAEREAAFVELSVVIAQDPEAPAAGRLYFLRGALGMALLLEDARAEDYLDGIVPDLKSAIRLDDNPKYPSWLDSMNLVLAYIGQDDDRLAAAMEASVANVALYPVGNTLSITGTMSGLPVDTGMPHKAVELLEAWVCDAAWCMDNTDLAPWSQPGIQLHFADAYARIGDKETTRLYLERSLQAPKADRWPYRDLVQQHLDDLDAYVDPFIALGDDGSAVSMVYANSDQGCVLCHGY
jgi:hypothetical protein